MANRCGTGPDRGAEALENQNLELLVKPTISQNGALK